MAREHLDWQIKIRYLTRTEAKEIIDNYKKQFPGIQKYMDDNDQLCTENMDMCRH